MKRLLTLLPVLVFCLLCAPAVLAVNVDYLDENGDVQTCTTATEVTADDTEWNGGTTGGWYVVPDGGTTIGSRVTVTGDVHLILADGATLNANKGINVGDGTSLTIYAQSEGTGALNATGAIGCAGIGGGGTNTVTITGGTVTATGGTIGSGIGGGSTNTVTITGGTVTATGGNGGSGIGGGSTNNVTISGGTVNATGGNGGSGIGGGGTNTVTITGGTVTATGGNSSSGIGGGTNTVTISGGTVTANGGNGGAGIGGGSQTIFSTGENGNAVIFTQKISGYGGTDPYNGIIFFLNQKEGKVYGNVTPTEDFTIPEGNTLVIEEDKSLTLQNGVTLTNNGTIQNNGTLTIEKGGALTNNGTIQNNGTLTNQGTIQNYGTVTGSVEGNALPQIKTQPQSVTAKEGKTASFTVEATMDSETPTYQWQQNTATSGSNWENIESATAASYTISNTTTGMNGYQYRCIVKDQTGNFTVSDAATLTVTKAVTGVTLDKTSLALIVGDTATLAATVTPDDAANKAVTWSTDVNTVATVNENGLVTAVGPGTATITATAADGSGKSASCTVTVTAKTYGLSIDPGAVGFGTMAPGYTQPAVREVTVKNTGNQTLSLTHPTANQFEVGKLNQLTLAPGEKAVFTVRPKAGLPLGSYRETVVVKASGGVEVSVNLTFVVSDGGTGNEKCTLHFNTMGGLPLDDVVRGLGAPVELWPYTPVRAGYLFMGWYSDEALTKAVNTVVLVDDTTIYAKWAVDPAATAAQSGSGTGGSSTGSGS
uniref:Ig-like domain-containing protein n=1 Tax=uncultured Subdoligranulum sp. TaxID=512298 RepID=UPI002639176C